MYPETYIYTKLFNITIPVTWLWMRDLYLSTKSIFEMLNICPMPHWEEDIAMVAKPSPPRKWRGDEWLTWVEGGQWNSMIPCDDPITIGIIDRKFLDAFPGSCRRTRSVATGDRMEQGVFGACVEVTNNLHALVTKLYW